MPTYTREQVIAGRKCGLKYFDKAVSKIGRDALIKKGITLAKDHSGVWGGGWSDFNWGVGNAVIDTIKAGQISQTWNADEAFTTEELEYIAKELNIPLPPKVAWARRDVAIKHRDKKKSDKPSKEDVVPGAKFVVVNDGPCGISSDFLLDGHMYLLDNTYIIKNDCIVTAITKPRKKDSINLVKINVQYPDGSNKDGEVFYCDLVSRCKKIEVNNVVV